MTTDYPIGLDGFINPSGSNYLDGPPGTTHADLHTNENDAIRAIQARVGVTGSTVPTSMDYELHNVEHGHNHDGINSRPVALGTSGSVDFGDGYFTDFTTQTQVGDAISRINEALKQISSSLNILSGSGIAFEAQGFELTPSAVRVDLTGSGVSGSVSPVSGGDKVTYTIPGIDIRQVLFLAEYGPFEGFSTDSMFHSISRGTTSLTNHLVSQSIWYTDISKSAKIFETEYTNRNTAQQAQKIVYKVYEQDGFTVKTTVTDIITYSGIYETTRIRTVI